MPPPLDKAHLYPGPPPVIWSPYMAHLRPGLAIRHRSHRVWYYLEPTDPLGEVAPEHSIMLTPEYPPTADLLDRVTRLESLVNELSRRHVSS